MWTDEQLAHFEVFGFLVIRQLFSSEEMELIIREFESVMLEERGGKPFDGQQRQEIQNFYMRRPSTHFIPADPRIIEPVKQILGPDPMPDRNNDSNFYVGDTVWHPDEGWSANIPDGEDDPFRQAGNMAKHYGSAIKVAFYLDPVDKHTGALRVIPGSHRNPYHDQLWSLTRFNVQESDVPRVRPQLLERWARDGGDPQKAEQWFTNEDMNLFGTAPSEIPASLSTHSLGTVSSSAT